MTTAASDFVPVDLGEVAREVVSDLEVQIERVGGRVEVGKLPTIQAEPLQMRQLLQNLIANALKFHRADEPPVVKIEARYVTPREQRHAAEIAGRRASAASPSRTTASASTNSTPSGFSASSSGCTPATSMKARASAWRCAGEIVECHGGEIPAHSALGQGSTFEIVLPAAQAKKKRNEAE